MAESGFIWIDWCIIGFIALSGIISLWRGFFRECLSVIIWILAVVVAWLFADPLTHAFDGFISSYSVKFTISAVILAIIVLIIGAFVSMLVSKLISVSGLSGSDRLLGVIFGIFRGVVVMTILIGILVYMPIRDMAVWHQSVLIPKFEQLASWSKEMVSSRLAPKLREDMTTDYEKNSVPEEAFENN